MLPPSPVVSPGAFSERPWPAGLAWSATGTHGFERLRTWELAGRAAQRFAEEGEDAGARVRGAVLGLLGDFMGISTERPAGRVGHRGRPQLLLGQLTGSCAAGRAPGIRSSAGPGHMPACNPRGPWYYI